MRPKENYTKYYFIGLGVVWVIGIIMIAASYSCMAENPHMSFLNAFSVCIDRISTLKLRAFTPYNPKTMSGIGTWSLALLMGFALFYLDRKKQDRMAPQDLGARFLNGAELKKLIKEKAYPYNQNGKDYKNNVIFTKNVSIGRDNRTTNINLSTIVEGAPGRGKSRFVAKPAILQADGSYSVVITDPKCELVESTGKYLEEKGYKVVVFNLSDMKHSYNYNPFDYIRSEENVLNLINTLIQSTTPVGASKGDPFWENSEKALLTAICFYLWKHRPPKDRNFQSVMKLLRSANISEEDGKNSKSPLDVIFEKIGRKDPGDIGYTSYTTFKMGAGKTMKSILISCAVRLNAFDIPAIGNMIRTNTDHPERNIDLKEIGFKPVALFNCIPSGDDTFSFLASMLYSQMFETLFYYAEHGGLKYQIHFVLDEFCNMNAINSFQRRLAVMRSYGLFCTIFIQSKHQLKNSYKDEAEAILGDCDNYLFLGSIEKDVCKELSERLGNVKYLKKNTSRSRGRSGSFTESYQETSEPLMPADKLAEMENDCILICKGKKILDKKFDYTKHPNYKYTGDADPKNKYNIADKFAEIKKEEEAKALEELEEVKKDIKSRNNILTAKQFFDRIIKGDKSVGPSSNEDLLNNVAALEEKKDEAKNANEVKEEIPEPVVAEVEEVKAPDTEIVEENEPATKEIPSITGEAVIETISTKTQSSGEAVVETISTKPTKSKKKEDGSAIVETISLGGSSSLDDAFADMAPFVSEAFTDNTDSSASFVAEEKPETDTSVKEEELANHPMFNNAPTISEAEGTISNKEEVQDDFFDTPHNIVTNDEASKETEPGLILPLETLKQVKDTYNNEEGESIGGSWSMSVSEID